MDPQATCPACRRGVQPDYFYCPYCGKNIRPAPLPTTIPQIIKVCIASAIVMPYGLYMGVRYLRQTDERSRYTGIMVLGVTIIIFLIQLVAAVRTMDYLNAEINRQMMLLQGF